MKEKRYYSSHKDYLKHRRPYIFYHIMCVLCNPFIPKFKINYKQEINGQNIYVANHSKQCGVLFAARRFDKEARIWCDADLCFYRTAPKYVVHTFFHDKKLFWPLALIIAPILVNFFRAAEVIPVYRDARLITTYKKTIQTLKEGKNVILFAESPKKYNKYLNELNKGFVDVGRMVNKYMKKEISFVPMYIAWSIGQTSVGMPIKFDANNNYRDEIERVSNYISDEIISLAEALPEHKVISFN